MGHLQCPGFVKNSMVSSHTPVTDHLWAKKRVGLLSAEESTSTDVDMINSKSSIKLPRETRKSKAEIIRRPEPEPLLFKAVDSQQCEEVSHFSWQIRLSQQCTGESSPVQLQLL